MVTKLAGSGDVDGWKEGRMDGLNEGKKDRRVVGWMDVSLNQTLVHSPTHSKANLLTLGCGEGK